MFVIHNMGGSLFTQADDDDDDVGNHAALELAACINQLIPMDNGKQREIVQDDVEDFLYDAVEDIAPKVCRVWVIVKRHSAADLGFFRRQSLAMQVMNHAC